MDIVVRVDPAPAPAGRRALVPAPQTAEPSVADQAAAFLSGWGRTEQVRRRVLAAQLQRLSVRVGAADQSAQDAAARAGRLASRLERNQLEW